MKKVIKLFIAAIPALVIAATVGLASMGCEEATNTTTDLSAKDSKG